jgi:hypothetical protein
VAQATGFLLLLLLLLPAVVLVHWLTPFVLELGCRGTSGRSSLVLQLLAAGGPWSMRPAAPLLLLLLLLPLPSGTGPAAAAPAFWSAC